MCGICGKLNFDRHEPADRGLLRTMMDLIRHRGPDGAGEFFSGPMSLGHRRLSIIDLETGDQPMSNEDGTVTVVFNGEIYNFRELRSDLESKGHRFKSATDTEVIVHLYEEMGDDCVTRLQGMFAFALWDESKQHLLLARDRVGIKPLYFIDTGSALVFGSEIKSLLADPATPCRVNAGAIDRFLTYYYLPGNDTLLQGIQKLEAGHCLSVDAGRITKRQYWNLTFDIPSPAPSFGESVERLRDLLRQSVKDHLISDVPVGVLLSGGVDSTGVLRYASEESAGPIHTFTVGFSGANFSDERPYASMVARQFGTIHQEISLTAKEFRDFLPRYVWHMEDPVCEPPAIALFFVAELARRTGVKVLLSGEGGDEAFAGYPEYRNVVLLEQLKSLFGSASGLLRAGSAGLARLGWDRIERYGHLVELPIADHYFSRTASPRTPFNLLKGELYLREFALSIKNGVSHSPTKALFEEVRGLPLLNRLLYVDSKTWLPDDLLVKADKMTMATSVELRVPLLDPRILEFAASLPTSYKASAWRLKRIMKAALGQSVPQEVLKRKKAGFPVPYEAWMRNEMRDFVFDTILASDSFVTNYLDRAVIQRLLERHQSEGGLSKEVFSLMVMELWHRQFVSKRFTDLTQ